MDQAQVDGLAGSASRSRSTSWTARRRPSSTTARWSAASKMTAVSCCVSRSRTIWICEPAGRNASATWPPAMG